MTRDVTNIKTYRNGSLLFNNAFGPLGISTNNLYIGCLNNNNVASSFSTRQWAMMCAGGNIESFQSDLYSAINTYMTTLGTNV